MKEAFLLEAIEIFRQFFLLYSKHLVIYHEAIINEVIVRENFSKYVFISLSRSTICIPIDYLAYRDVEKSQCH